MAELPPKVAEFRARHRERNISPGYRGWLHFATTTIGAAAVIGFCAWRIHAPTAGELAMIPVFFLFSNLVEYAGHRGPMHHRSAGVAILFERHAQQHHRFFTHDAMEAESPRDFQMVLFPPVMLAFFLGGVAPIGYGIALVSTANVGYLFVATGFSYFLLYEWMHFAYHLPQSSWLGGSPLIARLRQHHLVHHDIEQMTRVNFNITFPIGDWLFGTGVSSKVVGNQRGNVAVYLLFSLAAAAGAGYGVYVLIRDRPHPVADEEVAVHTAEAPVARPTPTPVDEPIEPPTIEPPTIEPPAVEPAQRVDIAEARAVEPDEISDPPKDTVLLGTPGLDGGLDATSVERVVKRYTGRYERCMRHTHEKYRMGRGSLRVTFGITANGSVDYASGQATNIEEDLASCVLDVIKKLRFDKPSVGARVKVVYPFAFVPAAGGDAGDPYPAEPPHASEDPLAQ